MEESVAEQMARMRAAYGGMGVELDRKTIGGVRCFILTPRSNGRSNRTLLHVHGGAYVGGGGEQFTGEAGLVAGVACLPVISVDYRMPPDHPFPAALDDSIAVWRELLKTTSPSNIGIFGGSAGGGLTLALIHRAKREGIPLPGAIAPGTPWADLTKTGDSYYINEAVDNALPTYDGFLAAAAQLYANGRDLKEPELSPVYGDFSGFPPTLMTTGTRDLFLSNAVRVYRHLRNAGIEARLDVYEGVGHGQYLSDPSAPESQQALREIAEFFAQHLGR